jgi:SAM-dependent methyltransferase
MVIPHPERARLFGEEAERYDQTRPSYPHELIDEVLGPSPEHLSVLDVGCGTGIASRLMAARGAHVLGVELNASMAAVAERRGIPVETARFETWDPAGRVFDRVTAAQAWHWIDLVTGPAKAASLLRPNGRLCVFSSVGYHPDQLALDLEDTYQRAVPGALLWFGYGPSKRSDATDDYSWVTDGIDGGGQFEPPEEKRFAWSRDYTKEQWLSQLRTHTDHAALPPDDRERLFGEIGNAIDRFGGHFTMSCTTVLFSATRR